MKKNRSVKGIKARHLFIPTILIILLMLMAFVVITILINKRSEKDANDAHDSAECISLVSGLQSRASSSAETISSFIYNPKTEPIEFEMQEIPPGSGNYQRVPVKYKYNNQPLESYIENISISETEQHYVYNTIKNNYKINEAILLNIYEVVEMMDYMQETQKHAIYLVSRMKEIDFPQEYLEIIGTYTFTAEDLTYETYDEIREAALNIIFEREYALTKKDIATKITQITRILREESEKNEEKSDALVWTLRRTLWVLTALIIFTLLAFFTVLYKKLISTIARFAKNIQENEMLDDEKGLYEANYLALSYNELLDKKSDYEYRLAAVAENDPLTGFKNRYSYNKFLATKADSSHSTCIFMLDINNLKYVNDNFGHDKGDELIKNSSLAIKETFMTYESQNCYRLGGDEFIAILDNIEENKIDEYVTKFKEMQKKYRVSIAIGYAYTSDVAKEGYENLMIEADKKMYENKKEMKNEIK